MTENDQRDVDTNDDVIIDLDDLLKLLRDLQKRVAALEAAQVRP